MKRSLLYCSAAILSFALFFACKKQDPPVPPVQGCQVLQFGAAIPNVPIGPSREVATTPYLFKKTFDAAGKVKTIDAYLFEATGANHISASLSYSGSMVYLLNNEKAKDTLFAFALNSAGKVASAEEYTPFSYNFTTKYRYEYFYNSLDKVYRIHNSSINNNSTNYYDTATYDPNGNVILFASNKFEYDLTKTVKTQFYHDIDYRFASSVKGTRLLGYLGYFPELVSPPNLRIIARAIPTSGGAYYANYNLFSHQIDATGKLTSYGFSGSGANLTINPISYNCDAVLP